MCGCCYKSQGKNIISIQLVFEHVYIFLELTCVDAIRLSNFNKSTKNKAATTVSIPINTWDHPQKK